MTVGTAPAGAGSGAPEAGGHITAGLAVAGSGRARLLAGAPGREDLHLHRGRSGRPAWDRPDRIFDSVQAAGLRGRGGGYFPLAEKMDAARRSPGPAVVVVNATESEPASAKDRYLMLFRPHLILDGAQAVAAAVNADRVVLAVHSGAPAQSLCRAVGERDSDPVPCEVSFVPDRYVAGESGALVSWIDGGPALPTGRSRPSAISGVGGRPTVVSNAETVSHVALIVQAGPDWFRAVGPEAAPGSVLITVTGDVASPGRVLEVVGPATVGEAVAAAGGSTGRPAAVLIGGYAGRWQPVDAVWDLPVDPVRLAEAGSPIGCGLFGVLAADRCGLAEAARLAGWLATQRAGQCGTCDAGLPALAEAAAGVAAGSLRGRKGLRRIADLGDALAGRNLCHLPDGALSMVESALTTFWDEMALHEKRRCSGRSDAPLFPIPAGDPQRVV